MKKSQKSPKTPDLFTLIKKAEPEVRKLGQRLLRIDEACAVLNDYSALDRDTDEILKEVLLEHDSPDTVINYLKLQEKSSFQFVMITIDEYKRSIDSIDPE